MPTLTAKFDLDVAVPALLALVDQRDPEALQITVSLGHFTIEVALIPASTWAIQAPNDPLWTTNLAEMRIDLAPGLRTP